jgi:ribosome-binding protein aMBF1 (putative translation factor)
MLFSDTIRRGVQTKGWSIKKFADEIGRTPEHARKISNGTAFPSNDLTVRIAEKLEVDQTELQQQLDEARWERRHKKKPPTPAQVDLGPIEEAWRRLSQDQRQYVLCVANCFIMAKVSKTRAQ